MEVAVLLELVEMVTHILEAGEEVIMEVVEVAIQVGAEDLLSVIASNALLLLIPLPVLMGMDLSLFHILNQPRQLLQRKFPRVLQLKIPL